MLFHSDILYARLRECWVLKDNLRQSTEHDGAFQRPTWHAVILEGIEVYEQHRRQGHCKRLIEDLCADSRFELVIVEGVQNENLSRALHRWGWEFDPHVMDFYKFTGKPICSCGFEVHRSGCPVGEADDAELLKDAE